MFTAAKTVIAEVHSRQGSCDTWNRARSTTNHHKLSTKQCLIAYEAARRCQAWSIWGTTTVATVKAIQHILSVNCTIQTMEATRDTLCQVIAPSSG